MPEKEPDFHPFSLRHQEQQQPPPPPLRVMVSSWAMAMVRLPAVRAVEP